MSNGTGDLIQATLAQWPDNSCGVFEPLSLAGSVNVTGQLGVVNPTDAVTINYKLGSNKLTWTQTVTIGGRVVSTLTSDSGPYMKGWGTGTECNNGCNGTISPQKYTNTVITLDTGVTSGGTTISGLTSEQGGKVWKVAAINIPKMV
ncbi:hypothetical protein FRC10_000358 [Ceratobasidium sp. 414]|nr:hypothetical protein FRC10_000358 [Ceratobasidium sp. 414]